MISKLNLGPLHKPMHTQMYMHQHICGPTQIPTYIDTTHMWKRKRKTKKKEVDSYLNTPAWEGGPENTMQTLPVSVNYVWTFIAMDEIGWHLAVDHRDFWKTEEIWVPSKLSYLSITKVDSFKFVPPEFKKCHSATVLLQELRRVVYKHPRDSWQSFIRHLIKSLIKCKSSSRLMKRRLYGIDVWLLPILWYSFNVLLISYDYSTS